MKDNFAQFDSFSTATYAVTFHPQRFTNPHHLYLHWELLGEVGEISFGQPASVVALGKI